MMSNGWSKYLRPARTILIVQRTTLFLLVALGRLAQLAAHDFVLVAQALALVGLHLALAAHFRREVAQTCFEWLVMVIVAARKPFSVVGVEFATVAPMPSGNGSEIGCE
jgi:hypothetical protein